MGWVAPVISSIIGVIAITFTSIYVVKTNKRISKIDIEPNAPIIDMTARKQFTKGFCFGRVKTQKLRKNGCYYFEVYPIDAEQGENKPKPDMVKFVVAKEMVKRHPKSDASYGCEKITILPRTSADLPESMRDTEQGKWMTKEGQLGHITKTFGEAIPAGDEAIFEAMTLFARGNISRSALSKLKEENNEMRKILTGRSNQEREQEKN